MMLLAALIACASAFAPQMGVSEFGEPVIMMQTMASGTFRTPDAALAFATHKLRAHKARNPQLFARANVSIPMNGDIYPLGIYYSVVGIGTPSQKFAVALDTGSDTLIVPGRNCNGCAQNANRFDPSLSSTIKPLSCDIGDCDNYCGFGSAQCTFSNSYQTCVLKHPNQVCTISGPVYEDDFALGSLHAKSAFGVITYQTPGFQQLETVDGIIGLAGSTSFGRPEPIPALHQAGMIANSFAFCFANRTHGRFMVGGAAAGTYRPGSTQWIPLSGEYSITMTSILVGGVAVQFSSADAILDSGTNVLLLDSDTFSAVQTQFTQCSNCAHVNSFFNGGCHNLTASELAAYPPLQLQFGTATLSMPPRSYLVEHPAHNNARCLGIISTGPGGFLIIGDTTMWEYTTIFDRTNQRVGFAQVDTKGCAK
jgi:hypothetical protein